MQQLQQLHKVTKQKSYGSPRVIIVKYEVPTSYLSSPSCGEKKRANIIIHNEIFVPASVSAINPKEDNMSEEEASEIANNAAKAEFEDATAAVEIAKQQLKAGEICNSGSTVC